MKTADLLGEIELMISSGEWPERIATRLGYPDTEALYRRLAGNGRRDVAERIRQQDKTSAAYQRAHYTPMDEVVARERAKRAVEKRRAA